MSPNEWDRLPGVAYEPFEASLASGSPHHTERVNYRQLAEQTGLAQIGVRKGLERLRALQLIERIAFHQYRTGGSVYRLSSHADLLLHLPSIPKYRGEKNCGITPSEHSRNSVPHCDPNYDPHPSYSSSLLSSSADKELLQSVVYDGPWGSLDPRSLLPIALSSSTPRTKFNGSLIKPRPVWKSADSRASRMRARGRLPRRLPSPGLLHSTIGLEVSRGVCAGGRAGRSQAPGRARGGAAGRAR